MKAGMSSARHFEPPPKRGQPLAEFRGRVHRHANRRCAPSLGLSDPTFAPASELRAALKTVYCLPECSENVNGFVRNMHDMRNMQISVCLCGKRAYV
jgi:hypothetical protein